MHDDLTRPPAIMRAIRFRCWNLVTLDLTKNNLEGSIPPHLGNLSSLQALYLSTNRFKGDVPALLGQLKRTLYLSSNQFQGTLPRNLGLALPNIEKFSVWGNQFGGRIPLSISNASKLSLFDISINNFFGGVSVTIFGNLKKLAWLGLIETDLGSAKADDLKFITSLTNCSSLRRLYLDNSNFGGELPDSVGNLSTQIESLSMAFNPISGNIPPGIKCSEESPKDRMNINDALRELLAVKNMQLQE
ncbi:hypothetical protein TIFTF001_036168 [Ficus carica]|uniref:Uncharacterized protein n=1 Tax=Ficus carica TaxID=3494 RepID=A0AA88E746_FICCA|nr:hypothetical protein TIFTF001_036168 [Ficus carica]